jgi:hypothetical protein
MIASLGQSLRGATSVLVAADLTLPTETIERRTASAWKREDPARLCRSARRSTSSTLSEGSSTLP